MNYKHSHVVNADGYKTAFVLVHILEDGTEQIQFYTLKDGERLVDTAPPSDLVKPRWNDIMWRESATAEEIAATLPTLDDLKTAKKSALAAARWTAQTAHIMFDGNTYHADETAQGNIHAAVTVALPGNREWKTVDGMSVKLNVNKLKDLFTAIEARKEACYVREAELSAAIDACQTAEEVAAIKWEED